MDYLYYIVGQEEIGEWPVSFILYWDGRKIRAYIPEEGTHLTRSGEPLGEVKEKQVAKRTLMMIIILIRLTE